MSNQQMLWLIILIALGVYGWWVDYRGAKPNVKKEKWRETVSRF